MNKKRSENQQCRPPTEQSAVRTRMHRWLDRMGKGLKEAVLVSFFLSLLGF